MLTIDAHIIEEAADEVNQYAAEPVEIRANYEGRFGETSFGVVSSDTYLEEFEATLAVMHVTGGNMWASMQGYDFMQALTDIREARRKDNMGLNTIHYYPLITVEGELRDSEPVF